MASQTAVKLKKEFMSMPVEYFEPLTFGELETGKKFICLPIPGDNSGHGGFKGTHWIFLKTEGNVKETSSGIAYSNDNPHGKAFNMRLPDNESHFPHAMLVIRVE